MRNDGAQGRTRGLGCSSSTRLLSCARRASPFGRRLRATNVSLEDREDLSGHESDRVRTDYSASEIRNLIQAANPVIRSRNAPELTVLRVIQTHVSP
jgi:hypothetical protein